MFGLLNSLSPGISKDLLIPHRITESLIPSHDAYKKVCPLNNDTGVTMQTKYEGTQSYPNCIFGNKYRAKYPRIDNCIRLGLSNYKLNNQLHAIDINPSILRPAEPSEDVIERPEKWMNHIKDYIPEISSAEEAWKRYKQLRGDVNKTLKCKVFGEVANNPLDLFELIFHEIRRKTVSKDSTTTEPPDSPGEEAKQSHVPSAANEEWKDEFDLSELEELDRPVDADTEPDNVPDSAAQEEDIEADADNEPPEDDSNYNKTTGGKCMDLLKALYKFIYTAALQVWVMVHRRFLSRTNHDQSRYEYIFYLIPKTDIKNCAYIINADNKNSREGRAGIWKMKLFEKAMVLQDGEGGGGGAADSEQEQDKKTIDYILSVSASEFVACTLKYIITQLTERKIVTKQTEVKQRSYAISITNVCMINSVTITGMQNVPICDQFIKEYNQAMIAKWGSPEDTLYVSQLFNKHFQYKMKVYGLKRLKHKNVFAFPVFITGVFFSPDRPLNKVCDPEIMADSQRMMTNVTRSYFTYGAYFTPNIPIVCVDAPNMDTFPSYLVRRCGYWYSFDSHSYMMYLSNYNPQDDVDATLSDMDLCGVSELEWRLCIKDIHVALTPYALHEFMFLGFGSSYQAQFWPNEYESLQLLASDTTHWTNLPGKFYSLYLALTKLIGDEVLLQHYNIPLTYKNDDRIIMYILYHCYDWESLSQCIQTLRLGRATFKFISIHGRDIANPLREWTPFRYNQEAVQLAFYLLELQLPDIQKDITEYDEMHSFITSSVMFLKGNMKYNQEPGLLAYRDQTNFCLKLKAGQHLPMGAVNIKDLFNTCLIYNMEHIAYDEQTDSIFAKDGATFKTLIELLSVFLVKYHFEPMANFYFVGCCHQEFRLIQQQPEYVNVQEVRECLSYECNVEQKKFMNLEVIQRAYLMLSCQPTQNVNFFNAREYIMLRHMRDILRYSDVYKKDSRHEAQLQILEQVITKLTLSRKRKMEHISHEVKVYDSDNEEDDNSTELLPVIHQQPKQGASLPPSTTTSSSSSSSQQ